MTEKQLKILLKSQQGELDAVPMYLKLAENAKNDALKSLFKQLAAEEGHHAAVFLGLTGQTLQPNPFKSIAVPLLQKIIGWKRILPIIANAEYDAYKKYEPVVNDFPEIASVRNDEKRHGDLLKNVTL